MIVGGSVESRHSSVKADSWSSDQPAHPRRFKMKRLVIELTSCQGCPYLQWEENNGSGNYSGWSHCGKEGRHIALSERWPKFPTWCPLIEIG
jgi:hypothetical protein